MSTAEPVSLDFVLFSEIKLAVETISTTLKNIASKKSAHLSVHKEEDDFKGKTAHLLGLIEKLAQLPYPERADDTLIVNDRVRSLVRQLRGLLYHPIETTCLGDGTLSKVRELVSQIYQEILPSENDPGVWRPSQG